MKHRTHGRNAFLDTLIHHPWKVIGSCLLLVFAVGYFMRFVAPSVSYKDMLGADYPLLKDYEQIQREYTNDDNCLVLVEAQDGQAFTQELLIGVRELTNQLWKTPYSVRVDSVTNFQHTEAEGDDLTVSDLVSDEEELTPSQLEKIRTVALSEPLLLNRALNEDANVLAINISFAFPNKDLGEKVAAVDFVEAEVARFRDRFPNANFYVAGLVALDVTVLKISQRESGLFLGLVIVIVVVLLSLFLRAFKPVIASVLVFVFSIVAGLAFSGLMGWKLTPFTASVPLIILIIAVADCVHLITSYVHQMKKGVEKEQALSNALHLNFGPIAITSVTTAIGFLSLNFSESASIRALGSQVAFGVMFAFALSVTFLPALLALVPFQVKPKKAISSQRYQSFTDLLYRNRVLILTANLLLLVVLGLGLTRNEFNDRIPTYFAESLPWRQANDFSEHHFGGAYTFSYSLNSGAPGGVAEPEYLEKVARFADWLRSLPQVAYVNTITDTFKRLNKNMHGDRPEYYRLPEARNLAAQYLLLYEMSLPYGLDLNDQVNLDKSATKVLASFRTMSTSEILAMEKTIKGWMEENLTGITATGAGVQIMFAHLLDQDTKGLTLGAAFGLFLISLLLIVALKSWKVGLISILPNVFPAILAFGIWGLFVGQVGMGLAMVSGMTIGIIVDDTVHFLSKYLVARRKHGLDAREAVAYTFENVGPSIVFTTLVLVAGFVTMAFLAEFRVNSDMGKMTAIIMATALILDLVTLPILLMIFDKKPAPVILGQEQIA